MSQTQIKKVGIKHEAILQYLLANPTATYSEVAGQFGMTIGWVSNVVNSDCFKSQLKDRQDELFGSSVVQPIKEKIEATVHLAVDKLQERIPLCQDAGVLTNTADKLLGRLGFGTSPGQNGVVNNTQVNLFGEGSDLLARARAAAVASAEAREVKEVDSESEARNSYGSLDNTPPALPSVDPAWGTQETGDTLRAESTPPTGEEV